MSNNKPVLLKSSYMHETPEDLVKISTQKPGMPLRLGISNKLPPMSALMGLYQAHVHSSLRCQKSEVWPCWKHEEQWQYQRWELWLLLPHGHSVASILKITLWTRMTPGKPDYPCSKKAARGKRQGKEFSKNHSNSFEGYFCTFHACYFIIWPPRNIGETKKG